MCFSQVQIEDGGEDREKRYEEILDDSLLRSEYSYCRYVRSRVRSGYSYQYSPESPRILTLETEINSALTMLTIIFIACHHFYRCLKDVS